MFTQVLPLIALASLLIPVPTLAVPGAAWVRRQEDAQTSLTLDPAEISTGLEQDGQGDNPDPGQVRSLTSSNNFINFCLPFLDQGVVLTNGAQVVNGSCNQVPMGRIVSLDQAPRCKFVFPKNGDESIEENTAFTVQLKILSMETGNFVNANTNYYAAPQQVNDQGLLIGHSHVVIEALPSLQSTEPLDPNKFSFFKGLNVAADGNGIISTNVTAGLPAGVYRICSINTAANHQPALVSNAQHGSLDDCSYFTIQPAGANSTATANTTDASGTVADAASTTAASTATADAITTASVSQATDSASATDAATDAAASTQTDAGNGDSNSVTASSDDAAASTTATPDATTTASDSSAPAATESAAASDNGNNNNGGDNNNNNNGGNGDNQNNGGNNNNNNSNGSSDSVTTPAATESATSSDDAATTSIVDSTTSVAAPDATPTPGNDNNNNGASDSQGGNGTDDAATSTV